MSSCQGSVPLEGVLTKLLLIPHSSWKLKRLHRKRIALLEHLQQQFTIPEKIHKCARELDKVYIPSRYPDIYNAGAPMDFYDLEDAQQSLSCVEDIFAFTRGLA
ncbi:MAG: hypothetical protein BRC35_15365, partial [Cyanobacteria bacterium QH_10_48_56]